jgi:hypothetical protein
MSYRLRLTNTRQLAKPNQYDFSRISYLNSLREHGHPGLTNTRQLAKPNQYGFSRISYLNSLRVHGHPGLKQGLALRLQAEVLLLAHHHQATEPAKPNQSLIF